MVDAIEFNVNRSAAFETFVAKMPMGGALSARRPRDAAPIVAVGKDEMCRHPHEYSRDTARPPNPTTARARTPTEKP
jgi:hypothetical protein